MRAAEVDALLWDGRDVGALRLLQRGTLTHALVDGDGVTGHDLVILDPGRPEEYIVAPGMWIVREGMFLIPRSADSFAALYERVS